MFWFALVAFIFTTAVRYLLRPRPRFNERSPSRPSSVGEFQSPTAEEGRCIPYLAGTGLIEGPNVLWSGDYATEAMVEDGYTFGYKYYLGLAYGLCHGPIDRVLDVRFDEKVLSTGSVTIVPGQALAIDHGGVTVVALPAGTYSSPGAAAKACSDAVAAQVSGCLSRILYGYEIIAGVNDKLHFTTTGWGFGAHDVTVYLTPGRYISGTELAAEITSKTLTIYDLGSFPPGMANAITATFNTSTDKFTFAASTPTETRIKADSTFMGNCGFSEGADLVLGSSASSVAPYATGLYRFFFALRAGDAVRWTNGGTNSHAFFGMSGGAPDMTASSRADLDRFTSLAGVDLSPFADGTRIIVNTPDLFGGVKDEGGIVGTFDVYHGTETQAADDYLQSQFGATPPAWRGLSYVVARRPYWGTTPYLKKFSLMGEKCPNSLGLEGGRHRIVVPGALGDDANPASHLYELLTDDRFGLAIPASMVDLASFRAAGETLYDEGLGMSVVIDAPADGLDLVQDVMRHIDGVLYSDPETAQLTLKLIRDDYDVATLPVLDETNVMSVKLSRPSWTETKNVVKIQYTDRVEGHTPRVVQIQNLANVQMIGHLEVEEVAFHGLTNRAAAELIGDRVLRVLCYPLGQLEIVGTRAAQRLRPGAPFVLNWSPLGISGLVCRTGQPKPGEIRDNRITIDASEDVYALDRAVYSAIA